MSNENRPPEERDAEYYRQAQTDAGAPAETAQDIIEEIAAESAGLQASVETLGWEDYMSPEKPADKPKEKKGRKKEKPAPAPGKDGGDPPAGTNAPIKKKKNAVLIAALIAAAAVVAVAVIALITKGFPTVKTNAPAQTQDETGSGATASSQETTVRNDSRPGTEATEAGTAQQDEDSSDEPSSEDDPYGEGDPYGDPILIPDFSGWYYEDAIRWLEENNLEYNCWYQENGDVDAGFVYDQWPAPGEDLSGYTVADVYIAWQYDDYGDTMPDFTGWYYEDAFNWLNEKNVPWDYFYFETDAYTEDYVCDQWPAPGEPFPVGDTVSIYIACPETTPDDFTAYDVPNFIGYQLYTIEDYLYNTDIHLTVNIFYNPDETDQIIYDQYVTDEYNISVFVYTNDEAYNTGD